MNKGILILGGLLLDTYYEIDEWPRRGQDGFLRDQWSAAGGCAVNMAAAVRNLGGDPYVVSCVGSDAVADTLYKYMQEHDLSVDFLCRTGGSSGTCLVFSEPDGERTFLTGKGAESDVPEQLSEMTEGWEFGAVGITGYYLLNPGAERVVALAERLRRDGVPVLFDPSPLAGHIDEDVLKGILSCCSIMTPNMTELEILFPGTTIESGPAGPVVRGADAEGFLSSGGMLIVKDGARGGSVFTADRSFSYDAVPCRAIDTTGAGDCFAGALLYGAARGMEPEQMAGLAAECASKAAAVRGPHVFSDWRFEKNDTD